MDYDSNILFELTERECRRLARKTIRALQKIRAELSGSDSPLKNAWDEICAQVQGQESVYWDTYLRTVEDFVASEVSELEQHIKSAIWLYRAGGSEDEDETEPEAGGGKFPCCEEDVVSHIVHEYVLSQAADWHNARIEKYLESDWGDR